MRIDVLDPQTSERVFSCNGATLSGACPRATESGELPCAGMLLEPEPQIGWLGTFRFEVTGSSPACPLRFLS